MIKILFHKFSKKASRGIAAALAIPMSLLVIAAAGDITYTLETLNGKCSQDVDFTGTNVKRNGTGFAVDTDARFTDARTPTAHDQAATTITQDATHRLGYLNSISSL